MRKNFVDEAKFQRRDGEADKLKQNVRNKGRETVHPDVISCRPRKREICGYSITVLSGEPIPAPKL
jgi:hypothetical protein